jgi:catechol 2,3-dioxygenase-like lactoylglutathione lyase family enzyme
MFSVDATISHAGCAAEAQTVRRQVAMFKTTKTAFVVVFALLLPASSRARDAPPDRPVFSNFAIVLYVDDVRMSVGWYQDVLGFKLAHYLVGSAQEVTSLTPGGPEPYAANLLVGEQSIGLQRSSGEVHLPATGARYHFEVADLADLLTRVSAHGVSVHHRINFSDGRPFVFSVTDRDGHWFFFKARTAPARLPPN